MTRTFMLNIFILDIHFEYVRCKYIASENTCVFSVPIKTYQNRLLSNCAHHSEEKKLGKQADGFPHKDVSDPRRREAKVDSK